MKKLYERSENLYSRTLGLRSLPVLIKLRNWAHCRGIENVVLLHAVSVSVGCLLPYTKTTIRLRANGPLTDIGAYEHRARVEVFPTRDGMDS